MPPATVYHSQHIARESYTRSTAGLKPVKQGYPLCEIGMPFSVGNQTKIRLPCDGTVAKIGCCKTNTYNPSNIFAHPA